MTEDFERYNASTTAADVRARLAKAGFERAEVQGIRSAGAAGPTEFSVRVKGTGGEDVRGTIMPKIRGELEAAGVMKPSDSMDMAADAHSLLLRVSEPVKEMDIRRALATGADPYSLRNISSIEAADPDAKTDLAQTSYPHPSGYLESLLGQICRGRHYRAGSLCSNDLTAARWLARWRRQALQRRRRYRGVSKD